MPSRKQIEAEREEQHVKSYVFAARDSNAEVSSQTLWLPPPTLVLPSEDSGDRLAHVECRAVNSSACRDRSGRIPSRSMEIGHLEDLGVSLGTSVNALQA